MSFKRVFQLASRAADRSSLGRARAIRRHHGPIGVGGTRRRIFIRSRRRARGCHLRSNFGLKKALTRSRSGEAGARRRWSNCLFASRRLSLMRPAASVIRPAKPARDLQLERCVEFAVVGRPAFLVMSFVPSRAGSDCVASADVRPSTSRPRTSGSPRPPCSPRLSGRRAHPRLESYG